MRPRCLIPLDDRTGSTDPQPDGPAEDAAVRRTVKDALDELELPDECDDTVKITRLAE